MAHTPLPWILTVDKCEMHTDCWDTHIGTAPDNNAAVIYGGDYYPSKLSREDAALIVTAVNSHATLLSALEQLLGAQITVSPSSDDTLECLCCGRSSDEDFNEFEFHDESMPCGRAAAAIRAAKGDE